MKSEPTKQELQEKKVLIEAAGLCVNFPVKKESLFGKKKVLQAVTDVSLKIYEGETFGLVGESGCGKSTFANAALGLQKPSAGKVLFDGVDMSGLDSASRQNLRRRMQKIFQDPGSSLNPRLNVLELVSEPLRIRGGYTAEQRKNKALEMIRQVGLNESDLYRYPSDFSGGQQQRIAIARALILNPEFLVCDEPVSALDVSVHAQILNLLMEMQQKRKITYLFISHNLAVVKKICDRVGIMYLGKLVEYGNAEAIFANPVHPYTKALISSVLSMDTTGKEFQLPLKGDISSPIDPPEGCRFCGRCPVGKKSCETQPCELIEIEPDHFVACSQYTI